MTYVHLSDVQLWNHIKVIIAFQTDDTRELAHQNAGWRADKDLNSEIQMECWTGFCMEGRTATGKACLYCATRSDTLRFVPCLSTVQKLRLLNSSGSGVSL